MARVLSECVLLILFKGNQAQEIIPLACLSLEVMEGPSIFKLKHLYYPYIKNPNMWFVHEISQSHKTGILTLSPRMERRILGQVYCTLTVTVQHIHHLIESQLS